MIAVLLAAVGLYGVVSYLVTQRTREIGIRVALGARRQSIVKLVVLQGMRPAGVGLVTGVGVALVAGEYLASILFGARPRDPLVLSLAVGLMAGVALAAAALPALRASRIDPARTLKGG
ncbi:MAG: FtsX-like permease family protein [Acidobacteriota bacterium]